MKKNKYLLISSGNSQLLTQIAAVHFLNIPVENCDVFYIGNQKKSLLSIFKLICSNNGLNYKGVINNLKMPHSLRRRDYLNPKTYYYFLRYGNSFDGYVKSQMPVLNSYRFQKVIFTLRHKTHGDVFLLNFLKPKDLVLTADGVVGSPYFRNFNNWKWFGINSVLNKLPVEQKVYTPLFLKDETNKVGTPFVIPNEILFSVFQSIENTADILCFRNYFAEVKPKAIIFSQHHSLNKSCSELEELNYYINMIDDLIANENYPICFKPHPRDSSLKLDLIKKYYSNKCFVQVLPDNFGVLPIEFFYKEIGQLQLKLVTSTSSAPLVIRNSENKLFVYSSKTFSKTFQSEILNFSNENAAILKILP